MTELNRHHEQKMEHLKEKIGQRIAQLREARSLTQKEVISKLGKAHTSIISNWEAGTRLPEFSSLVALADIFEVNLSYLLCQDDVMEPQTKVNLIKKIAPVVKLHELNEIGFESPQKLQREISRLGRFPVFPLEQSLSDKTSDTVFAIMIEDESMVPSNKPERITFIPGDIVLIDPTFELSPGVFVLAYAKATREFYFRKYRQVKANNKQHFELIAFNDDWPALDNQEDEIVIVGGFVGLVFRG
ncbi:MAG: LexA family transcriptional regulator [Legionellales bacterium]|nr:LexA family transcriptional regulator [Legionellales bacterium]